VPRPSVLVDTGALVALVRKRDRHHERIKEFLGTYFGELITTWPVLTEAAHLVPIHVGPLGYAKIQRKLAWDEQRIEQFIRQLYIRAEVLELHATAVEVPRDPKDPPILATLIVSGADVLVSGDRDLLELRGEHPTQTPAEFVRRL